MTDNLNPSTNSIRKTHRLYDENKQNWFDVYTAPAISGGTVHIEVPREEQGVGVVARFLLRKGAALPPWGERDAILTAAINSDAPIVHRAARNGWQGDSSFVSHGFVAVTGDTTSVIVPPESRFHGPAGHIDRRGDLEGWQELIAVAQHSTAMTVALSAVFAAPLLALVQRPSFALVLVGPSRCGKSSAQLAAASALGFGREQDLPSLRATDAGQLAAAIAFNDHAYPINEIGTAKGPKKDIYVALRDHTYALMNGQDIIRHPSFAGSETGTASFTVLPIFSSEHSPDTWAARNGEARDEGETARLIGLPVLYGGRATIFDRPPQALEGDELDRWQRERFRRLREGLPGQRGIAFERYLDYLTQNRARVTEKTRRLVAHFEGVMATPGMGAIARDIISKFGVLYAGFRIAIDADVLPFDVTRKWPGQYMSRACRAALAELPDPRAELRASLQLLRDRLGGPTILDRDRSSPRQMRFLNNAEGFSEPREGGRTFVVRAQVFLSWFGTTLEARRVLEWLDDEGFLDKRSARTVKRSLEWAQKQPMWPDGSRPRSICIYLPRGFDDLDD